MKKWCITFDKDCKVLDIDENGGVGNHTQINNKLKLTLFRLKSSLSESESKLWMSDFSEIGVRFLDMSCRCLALCRTGFSSSSKAEESTSLSVL